MCGAVDAIRRSTDKNGKQFKEREREMSVDAVGYIQREGGLVADRSDHPVICAKRRQALNGLTNRRMAISTATFLFTFANSVRLCALKWSATVGLAVVVDKQNKPAA